LIIVIGYDDKVYGWYARSVYQEWLPIHVENRTGTGWIEGFEREFITCSIEEASMIKYSRNCFYAAKVSLFNEIKALCDKMGIDFEVVRGGMLASGWIDEMHTQVPGHDGKLGFAGACFPKDLAAMVQFAHDAGLFLDTFMGAQTANVTKFRPEANHHEGAFTE
jgi:UDPglucose 6-dehydrogenase